MKSIILKVAGASSLALITFKKYQNLKKRYNETDMNVSDRVYRLNVDRSKGRSLFSKATGLYSQNMHKIIKVKDGVYYFNSHCFFSS